MPKLLLDRPFKDLIPAGYHQLISFKIFWHALCSTYISKALRKHNNFTPEVNVMETSLVPTFLGLSIVLGLMVGFGTLSVVRGVFTFLMFIGLALSAILNTAGVNMILSYFMGQLIIMGTSYLFLRTIYPKALVRVRTELQTGISKCH
jgi:hypothetical protein